MNLVMDRELTLPSLQLFLDQLPVAGRVALANKQVEHLFGFNDVGAARMKRFARGHNCIATYTDGCVVFHKMPLGRSSAILP